MAEGAPELNGKIRNITLRTDNLEEVDGHQSTENFLMYIYFNGN